MSITDELREWFKDRFFMGNGWQEIRDIADRIDAEHERECKEQYACGAEHGIGASIDASMIQTHGYVELPKDADGEYIHIGDVMEGVDKYDSLKKVMGEVTTISFDATLDPDDSKSVGIRVWSDDRRSYHTAYLDPNASVYRHHHAPTVEDVLDEIVDKANSIGCAYANNDISGEEMMGDLREIVVEYATKLRLAGGAE